MKGPLWLWTTSVPAVCIMETGLSRLEAGSARVMSNAVIFAVILAGNLAGNLKERCVMSGAAARRAVAKVDSVESVSVDQPVQEFRRHNDPTRCTRCGRSWDFTTVENFEIWNCRACGYEVRERPSEWARMQLAARVGQSPQFVDVD